MATKLDVYSDHQVPFDVAAFCRGRRFMPTSVALASALRRKEDAQSALVAAQDALDAAEGEVARCVGDMEQRMREMGEKK